MVSLLAGASGARAATPATSTGPTTTSTTAGSTTTSTTAGPTTTSPTTTGPTTTSPTSTRPPAPTTTTTFDPTFPAIELDAVDPRLVLAAQAELGNAQKALDTAQAAQATARDAANAAAVRLFIAAQQLQHLTASERAAAAAIQAAHDRLRDLAVAAYVSGGPGGPVGALLSAETIGDFARRQAVFTTVARRRAEALRTYSTARGAADRDTLRGVDAVSALTAQKADLDGRLSALDAAVTNAVATRRDRQNVLNLVTDAASSPGTDIPNMVLDAYRRAAASVGLAGCGLQWWALAGVGKVESDHGRLQHAHLTATGDLVPHIRGIPLNGTQDTQRVTDSGGDVVEAEGPMQFIPSTWAVIGRDGNGDNTVAVDNIYDASLGAAWYLCRSSADLTSDEGLATAFRSYNHSDTYAVEVLAYARAYQAAEAAGRVAPAPPAPLYTLAPPSTTTTTTMGGATTTAPPSR